MTVKKIPLLLLLSMLSVVVLSYGLGANGAISGNGGSVQSAGWLSGWSYRKAHNITGSTGGAQTNYAVAMSVHYDNGMDVEGEVYLSHKCRADFGDVRFTDATGLTLEYWIRQKVDAVQALFWIKLNYIPESPDYATIYIYYGNLTATTTSNKYGVFPVYSDFEDGTTQGWAISWGSYIWHDGVSPLAYEGSYAREAGRVYGPGYAGTGHFYERFKHAVYLSSGTYRMEGAARFAGPYYTPKEIKFLAGEAIVKGINISTYEWYYLQGNFTLPVGTFIDLSVEFHIYVEGGGVSGGELYYIDNVFVRKYCDPEPQHGTWSREQTSADNTPPEVASVVWTPTCPYPFVLSSVARQTEPVLVQVNASDNESGMGAVYLSYRVNGSQWWNTSMAYNLTSKLWTTVIPGQKANTTVEFFVTAYDLTGNVRTSMTHSYSVKYLVLGDENGDGICDLKDVFMVHKNYGKTSP